MIAFEYLKDFAEETVSEKHSAGLDLDCGDVGASGAIVLRGVTGMLAYVAGRMQVG